MKPSTLPAPQHVLIIEALAEGHHPKWVGLCAQAFYGLGAKITVAAPEPELLRERAAPHLGNVPAQFVSLGGDAHGAASLNAAAVLLEKQGADLCFSATIDNYASDVLRRAAIGLRPPAVLRGKLGGVYHRPRPLDPRQGGFGNAIKRRGFHKMQAQGWWNVIYLLDPTVAQSAPEQFLGLNCGLVPDPHEWLALPPRKEARKKLGVPDNAVALLHFGLGTKRKGLKLTLDALARCREHKKLFLLRAGKSPPDSPALAQIRALEQNGGARLLDYYVSSEEERVLYSAADVVLLPYLSHYGSANLLTGAAAAGKPVLASDFALVGTQVRSNRLGWLFRDQDAADLARQLDAVAISSPEERAAFEPALAAYAANATYAAFIKSIQAMYIQKQG